MHDAKFHGDTINPSLKYNKKYNKNIKTCRDKSDATTVGLVYFSNYI